MIKLAPSILSADFAKLGEDVVRIDKAGCDWIHIDVMDGEFVKNDTTSLMTEYSEYLKNITNIPLDVHLMVKDVLSYVKSFLVFEPRNITIHLEAAKDKEELLSWIKYIKDNGSKVGLCIKPNTKIEEIYEFLPYIHTVLVMTVEPGEGGQSLIPETIEKIRKLKEHIENYGLEVDIEADGGINEENSGLLKEAGCDIIVAGTAIINSDNFKDAVKKLK